MSRDLVRTSAGGVPASGGSQSLPQGFEGFFSGISLLWSEVPNSLLIGTPCG